MVLMSDPMLGFSEAQWALLKQGPLQILAHVGGADRMIDAAEWTALLDAVGAAAYVEDELLRGVCGALAEDFRSGADLDLGDSKPLEVFEEIQSVLATWGSDGGAAFRAALLEIGATIAESSGAMLTITYGIRTQAGGGWMLASGTSAIETAALEEAARALGLAVTAGVDEGVATDAP